MMQDHSSHESVNVALAPGARLRLAREALQLTIGEVAEYLHLRRQVIEDIESDAFDRTMSPVFIKGYLRAYAKLVGVPGDDIILAFENTHQANCIPTEGRTTTDRARFPVGWVLMSIIFAVVIILSGVWWTHQSHSKQQLIRQAKRPSVTSIPTTSLPRRGPA